MRLREQYAGWQHNVLQAFYNSLLAADLQLNELLAYVDSDGDGRISRSECVDALMGLKLGLTNGQTRQLIATLGFESRAKGDAPKTGNGWNGGDGGNGCDGCDGCDGCNGRNVPA